MSPGRERAVMVAANGGGGGRGYSAAPPPAARYRSRSAYLSRTRNRSARARAFTMPIRKIATLGHPVLRQVARSLSREELLAPEMQRFIDDLIETMRDANGAGLAAIQVY